MNDSHCYRLSNLWSMIDHNHWSQRTISVKLDTLWITHQCTCFRLALHVILSYNIITNIIIPSRQFSQLWQLVFNMFNVLTCPNFSLNFCGVLLRTKYSDTTQVHTICRSVIQRDLWLTTAQLTAWTSSASEVTWVLRRSQNHVQKRTVLFKLVFIARDRIFCDTFHSFQ